ncbi:hypothetical protein Taro_015914 [Colocasia esculenta]|uniref:Uncharacterized protein n=1 Tax=Colocasia esculenta TaxID=4460 RepID=A0A843URC7_COLES|nr:hypothetical protein [Colocasia esculenta]
MRRSGETGRTPPWLCGGSQLLQARLPYRPHLLCVLATFVESLCYIAHRLASLTRGGSTRRSSISAGTTHTGFSCETSDCGGSNLFQGGGFDLPHPRRQRTGIVHLRRSDPPWILLRDQRMRRLRPLSGRRLRPPSPAVAASGERPSPPARPTLASPARPTTAAVPTSFRAAASTSPPWPPTGRPYRPTRPTHDTPPTLTLPTPKKPVGQEAESTSFQRGYCGAWFHLAPCSCTWRIWCMQSGLLLIRVCGGIDAHMCMDLEEGWQVWAHAAEEGNTWTTGLNCVCEFS